MRHLLPSTIIWLGITLSSSAAILQLQNGDRLTGTLISHEDGVITFRSDLLGVVTVAETNATVVEEPEAAAPGEIAEDAGVAAAAIEAGQALPAAEEPQVSDRSGFDAGVARVKSAFDSIIPEGWSGRFSLGFTFTETNTRSENLTARLRAKKDSGKNHYIVYAQYQYATQTQTTGGSTKTLDQWGGGFTYQRDLSERWFIESNTDFLRNLVKDIDYQVTQTVSLGYKVIDTDRMKFTLLPGVAGQYIEASGLNERWLFYVTFGDTFSYIFNETFRFEQHANIRLDPTDTSLYQFEAGAAFIAKLNEWLEASLNYRFSYDTTVGPGVNRDEQQITFALGVPF